MDISPGDLPLGFLINTAGDQIREVTERSLGELDLTVVELGVMWLVDLCPNQSQACYARFQRRDLTTFGRIVERLEQKGFLARSPVEKDRRAYALSLTIDGQKAFKTGKQKALEAESAVFTVLGTDVETLRHALARTLGLGRMSHQPEAKPNKRMKSNG